MSLGILVAFLLGRTLAGREVIRAKNDQSWSKLPMLSHLSTHFKIQKYYRNEPKFKSLNQNCEQTKYNKTTYFDSAGVEHVPKEIRIFIGNRNIISNIYRIQVYDSTMRG